MCINILQNISNFSRYGKELRCPNIQCKYNLFLGHEELLKGKRIVLLEAGPRKSFTLRDTYNNRTCTLSPASIDLFQSEYYHTNSRRLYYTGIAPDKTLFSTKKELIFSYFFTKAWCRYSFKVLLIITYNIIMFLWRSKKNVMWLLPLTWSYV